jgi:GntP family gluconate:H+ symporter
LRRHFGRRRSSPQVDSIVVGLGTILGKMLAESGGARVVASTMVRALGESRVHWTMMLVAFIVGIPVFFSVGLLLLIPITFTVARYTKTPLLYVGVPLLAGLSVVHGLVPPHPGPMVAIELFKADVGKTILRSAGRLSDRHRRGPLLAFISRRVHVGLSGAFADQFSQEGTTATCPGLARRC